MTKNISRRTFTIAAASGVGVAALPGRRAWAQATKTVKVAVIAPLSGPWARTGQLIKLGAEMAVDEINEKGGVKAMGGAKLQLVSARCRRYAGESKERGTAADRAGT